MIPRLGDEVLDDKDHDNNTRAKFICGVVEGFYGRPWTMEQRRKLFTRMASMGMNTYIYAPKDDSKHRMHWRDLYTVDEAEPLTALIQSARECGVTFVYALSPGLDITYSSSKEVTSLKHKLEQVASFGCEAFALLFDDIEVELCDADKSLFQSFAAAQVSVTNEVYQHLRQPSQFFFCPTEYCASRAVPSVVQSKYLDTVGSKLLPNIEIMWTGPKVISRRISLSSIEEVTRAFRRPPLIWDNIHANDYDPKRLFLGPYDGRSPKLVPCIRGVLTNPNCEFESNFIALHTLAQWSRTSDDSTSQGKKDFILSGGPGSADIRLETEGNNESCTDDEDDDTQEPTVNASERYAPRVALRRAITVWHAEFSCATMPTGALLQKPPLSITNITGPVLSAVPQPIPVICNGAIDQMAILEVVDDYVQPIPSVAVSSSLSDSESSSSSTASSGIEVEPMDCIITPGSSPNSIDSVATSVENSDSITKDDIDGDDPVVSGDESVISGDLPSTTSETMQIDSETSNSTAVTIDDVTTIVDLFYLPFEYGPRAARLLADFFWIKTHAAESSSNEIYSSNDQLFGIDCDDCRNTDNSRESGVQSESWRERAINFQLRIRRICETIDRVIEMPNRALAYELFPYLWDMKTILFQLNCFVQWLVESAKLTSISRCYLYGSPFTWANKFYRDQVTSRDQEPWLFRGGLLGEIQRMLPFENSPDLLFHTCPSFPLTTMFKVRPYKTVDKDAVYKVCLETCEDGADGQTTYCDSPDVLPDKLVGPFLTYCAENCFVIVDDRNEICGYILTAPDAATFFDNIASQWMPLMMQKYPFHEKTEETNPVKEASSAFHAPFKPLTAPAEWYQSYVHISINARGRDCISGDPCAVKRAFTCAVTTLKILGSRGVFTKVDLQHRNTVQLYKTLGFTELPSSSNSSNEDVILLGRVI